MSKWFPRIYDSAMAPLEHARFKNLRAVLVGQARGRVLEIGAGTGANFPYYKNGVSVNAIEPNPAMMEQAAKRIAVSSVPINTYLSKAENMPFEDRVFDSIVATLVFCTIPEPEKALQEIKRVSKPGAKFLLLEHVRLDKKWVGKAQDVLTPVWKRMCDGCHLNRNTIELLEKAGFVITKAEAYYGGLFLEIECVVPEA